MQLTVAYRGHSTIVRSAAGLAMTLAPNLRRDRVSFVGTLRQPLRFREAIAALHDIVISELRYQPRDKSAYEAYLQEQKEREAAIRRTALFTVEGERDDICSIGQTVAAHDLCSGIRPYMKSHHVQLGVGHYGVFSGRRWQQQIYPRVREMIHDCH